MKQSCPLCLQCHSDFELYKTTDKRRAYFCPECWLVFVDPRDLLSQETEKCRYETHQNSIENSGYVDFLNRLLQPLLSYLHKDMLGLDFGCGPGPTLSRLLSRQGIACEDHDPFFVPGHLNKQYDFICATESFEHFHRPAEELEQLTSLLRPAGLLAIMTECWTDLSRFASWYYTRDPTHVSFYHVNTIKYICGHYKFSPLWSDDLRVYILQRY